MCFLFFVFLHFPIIIGLIHHFMLLQSTSLLVITAIGLQLCLAPCIYSGVFYFGDYSWENNLLSSKVLSVYSCIIHLFAFLLPEKVLRWKRSKNPVVSRGKGLCFSTNITSIYFCSVSGGIWNFKMETRQKIFPCSFSVCFLLDTCYTLYATKKKQRGSAL